MKENQTCFVGSMFEANTSDGTRTRNPRLRRPMPYPLGHGGDVYYKILVPYFKVFDYLFSDPMT